jgi:hypothetical protein
MKEYLYMEEYRFATREGERLKGTLIRAYRAAEGGTRYILRSGGRDYRCVEDAEGSLIEYAP